MPSSDSSVVQILSIVAEKEAVYWITLDISGNVGRYSLRRAGEPGGIRYYEEEDGEPMFMALMRAGRVDANKQIIRAITRLEQGKLVAFPIVCRLPRHTGI